MFRLFYSRLSYRLTKEVVYSAENVQGGAQKNMFVDLETVKPNELKI